MGKPTKPRQKRDASTPARGPRQKRKSSFPLALLDTGDDLATCSNELGCPVGQLVTPLNRIANRAAGEARPWAIDSGAYARFRPEAFKRRLAAEKDHNRDMCLFVAVPDIVSNARRTLECFHRAKQGLQGWPLAFVAQDGIEDLEIPWDAFDAIFIGGSTQFKMSSAAMDVAKAARICDKWIHVGRVNTPGRMARWMEVGIHSFDGTGLGKYSHMRLSMGELFANQGRLPLFPDGEEGIT